MPVQSVQTMFVLHPVQQAHNEFLNETDLAGPLIFCLMFGACLLAVRASSLQFEADV